MSESFEDLVNRLWNKVKHHMNWDDEKTKKWWSTKNPFFGGISPDDYLMRRPDKIEKLINALIDGDGP